MAKSVGVLVVCFWLGHPRLHHQQQCCLLVECIKSAYVHAKASIPAWLRTLDESSWHCRAMPGSSHSSLRQSRIKENHRGCWCHFCLTALISIATFPAVSSTAADANQMFGRVGIARLPQGCTEEDLIWKVPRCSGPCKEEDLNPNPHSRL